MSQIDKNPQMKVVLIFLHVPVFSSVGWLSNAELTICFFLLFPFFSIICLQNSTLKVKLYGEKTIETVSSKIPVLKKTVENEIEAMHNSRHE